MSTKATRRTVVGFDAVQVAGAVLLALVTAFLALGVYEFGSALGSTLPVSVAGPVVATLAFTALLVLTLVAVRRAVPSR